jgi:hypothetical protein
MDLYPISGLFFYRLIFMGWLVLGEGLFLFRLDKKPHFWWRLLGSLALAFGFALAFPLPTDNSFYWMFMFSMMFLATFALILFCFSGDWKTLLFSAICGYTTEHIAYETYESFTSFLTAGDSQFAGGLYSNTNLSLFSGALDEFLYFLSYIIVYWLIFLVCANRIKGNEGLEIHNSMALGLGSFFILIDVVFNSVVSYYSTIHYDRYYFGIIALFNVLCCVVALLFLFEMFYKDSLRKNLEIVTELRNEEKNQYALSKETVDLINIKCHDLKYEIRQIAEAKAISPDTIESLSNVINIYDSAIKTGNRALDVVLSQKSLFCSQNGIKFACIADGSQLNFISEEDTYSLFGNIIDNAIEAVKALEADKRIITLRIKSLGNMVSVNEHNPYVGTIKYEGSWPLTSKSDPRYHGFGIRSIRMVCEKYHGDLSLSSENSTFTISILFLKPGLDDKKE